jgi:hypothetical protein
MLNREINGRTETWPSRWITWRSSVIRQLERADFQALGGPSVQLPYWQLARLSLALDFPAAFFQNQHPHARMFTGAFFCRNFQDQLCEWCFEVFYDATLRLCDGRKRGKAGACGKRVCVNCCVQSDGKDFCPECWPTCLKEMQSKLNRVYEQEPERFKRLVASIDVWLRLDRSSNN